MCGPTQLGCHIREGFQSISADALGELAKDIARTAQEGVLSMASFWIRIESPDVASEAGGQWTNSTAVGFLQDQTLAITSSVFVVAILVAAIRTAWEQRAKSLQEMLKATMIFVAVSSAGAATVQLLAEWSDQVALDIIQRASPEGTAFGAAITSLLSGALVSSLTGQQLPMMIVILLGLMIFVAAMVQVVLLLIRSAMLILLAGTLPLAAAATNTEVGRSWFKKYCAWTLGFIAYKPAAALIYAAALRIPEAASKNTTDLLLKSMTGIMMMLLAVFALPAMLRLLVPAVSAVAGGAAGSGAALADPGGLASGAISLGRGPSGSSPVRAGGPSSAVAGGGAAGGPTGAALAAAGAGLTAIAGSGSGTGGGGSSGGTSDSGGGTSGSGGGASGSGGGVSGSGGAGAGGAVAKALGAAVNSGRKAGGALSGAAAHSAGEPGGGQSTPSAPAGSARSAPAGPGSSRPRPRPAARSGWTPPRRPPATPDPHPGPSGNW